MTQRTGLLLGSMLTTGFVAVSVALSLSDRVGLRSGAFSAAGLSRLHELERLLGIDVVDRSDVPFAADLIGHAALWGFGMLLIGCIFRRRTGLVVLAAGVFALSLSIEVGQHVFSSTRSAQIDDALANLAGIAAATVVVGAGGWLVDQLLRHRHPTGPARAAPRKFQAGMW